jgi:hypothetical protein
MTEPLLLLHKKMRGFAPRIFLVDKFVLLGAEARQTDAISVATLGYNLHNLNLWSRIAQHISLHNLFLLL